jgi:hypothetical protein
MKTKKKVELIKLIRLKISLSHKRSERGSRASLLDFQPSTFFRWFDRKRSLDFDVFLGRCSSKSTKCLAQGTGKLSPFQHP